jgi:hypothetical protein
MDDTQTRPDGQTAWLRHYVWAAKRRQTTHVRGRRGSSNLMYRQREIRWAYALLALAIALVLVAWRAF